jgi:ribonuclease HI
MILSIHTDGGSRGNPGPSAIGVVVEHDGEVIHTISRFLGTQTNNVAEYTAVLSALDYLASLPSPAPKQANFFLDSLLVVSQILGTFAVKNAQMQELHSQVRLKLQSLPFPVTFKYVPRAQNSAADALVNKALDENT